MAVYCNPSASTLNPLGLYLRVRTGLLRGMQQLLGLLAYRIG